MSFGAAKEMVRMFAYEQNYQVLVLDLCDTPALDYSACRAIEDIVKDCLDLNRKVVVALPDGPVAESLAREHSLDRLS
ncbi:MAG: sodium-independent anion transporter, partial [Pseudomonadales bacterium]|nr:sodium-independent anion transporter [Pseudomonadales bacterium]